MKASPRYTNCHPLLKEASTMCKHKVLVSFPNDEIKKNLSQCLLTSELSCAVLGVLLTRNRENSQFLLLRNMSDLKIVGSELYPIHVTCIPDYPSPKVRFKCFVQ